MMFVQLTTSGGGAWLSGSLTLSGSWTHSGATLALLSEGTISGGGSLFVSGGSLQKGNASTSSLGVPLTCNTPSVLLVGDGPLALSGGGVWTCAVTTQGAGSLQFLAGTYFLNSPASLNGTAGSVVVGGSSVVRVNVAIALGSATVVNVTSGSLFVNGNTTVTENAPLFVSSGVVAVTQPTTFTSLVTVVGGTLNITADVNLTGGIKLVSGSVYIIAGRVSVLGGVCSVSGGYLSVGAAQTLSLATGCSFVGGTLDGAGSVSVTSPLAWSGGTWAGSGALNVQATLTVNGSVSLQRPVGGSSDVVMLMVNRLP